MGTNFDGILNHAGEGFIKFIGKSINDVFTPSSFSFSGGDGQDFVNAEPNDLSQLALVGASGIGLASAAGIITVASHVQLQLKAMNNRINYAVGKLESIDKKIDQLLAITKRIDLKVTEAHLREAIKHQLRFSITEEGVDLVRLAQLEGDLDSMMESLDGEIHGNTSIRLSSDVRALLDSIYMVFASARIGFCTAYNYRHSSEAIPLISVDKLNEYYFGKSTSDLASSVLRVNSLFGGISELKDTAQKLINTRFSFCDEEDINSLGGIFDNFQNEHYGLFGDGVDRAVWNNLPDSIFSGADPAEDIKSYLEAWVWKTDAGLLWRLVLELTVFRSGYDTLLDPKNHQDSASKELVIHAPFKLAQVPVN